MPNFSKALRMEPDTLWDLVAYIMYLTDVRSGQIPSDINLPDPDKVLKKLRQ